MFKISCVQVPIKSIAPIVCPVPDSENNEPIEHVGENPLNPRGNCWKYDCSCTKLEDCIQCDDYHGISKRKRKKRKDKLKPELALISEEEKFLLKQFRKQEHTESQYDDFEPIGGVS